MKLSLKKWSLILGIIILTCVFSCMCLQHGCGTCLQCGQTAVKKVTFMLVRSLLRVTADEAPHETIRATHEGQMLEGAVTKT